MNTTLLFNFMRRAAMVLLLAVTVGATAQTESTLVARIDEFEGGIGCVYVSGWIYDSELLRWEAGAGEDIEIYGIISTTRYETDEDYEPMRSDDVEYFQRDDINEEFHLTGKHGFRITFDIRNHYSAWFPEDDGTSDSKIFWVSVYARVNNGNGYEEILTNGPFPVGGVKSPEWHETRVTQYNMGMFEGFITNSWYSWFDGDFNTFESYNHHHNVMFESDVVIIPTRIMLGVVENKLHLTAWRLAAKLNKEDEWTWLTPKRDWPNTSSYNMGVFDVSNEEYRGYRYFRLDVWPPEKSGMEVNFYMSEVCIIGFRHQQLEPQIATCSQVGIVRKCYQRETDGKYFADYAATIELDASSVEIPKKDHEPTPCGTGCWQCWMCQNYFSDEACTTPYPTWSIKLPGELELIEDMKFLADADGKFIQGTEIQFKPKELYEGYIRSVKVGETELTPDQHGIYTLTMGDADVVVTAKVGLLALADGADNYNAISAVSGEQVLVKLKGRTLYKDGYWNTLSLPFNMSAQQVSEQLAPTALKTLESVSLQDGTLTFNFADATEIQAGKPYIIRWTPSDDLVEPTFTGITIPDYSTTDVAQVYYDARCQSDDVDFVGTYAPLRFNCHDYSILMLTIITLWDVTSSILCYPSEGAVIGSGQGYFLLKGIHDGQMSEVKEFVLNTGGAVGIGEMKNEESRMKNEGDWFDLGGRKLAGKPTQKGIYIVNGKKIIK